MKFDFFTFIFSLAVIEILIAVFIIYFILRYSNRGKSVKYFLLFLFLNACGLIGMAFCSIGYQLLTFCFYVIFVGWSWYFLFLSLILLRNRWTLKTKRLSFLLLVFIVISTVIFFYNREIRGADKVYNSVIAFSLFVIAGFFLYRHKKTYFIPSFFYISIIVFALLNLFRLSYHVGNLFQHELYQFIYIDFIFAFVVLLFILIMTFGLLMISQNAIRGRLFRQEYLNQLLFSQLPLSVVITDKQKRIKYVNNKFTDVSGYDADEVQNLTPDFLKTGLTGEDVYSDLRRKVEEDEVWHGTFVNRKKNGEIFYEETTISSLKNEQHLINGYIAIKQDVTERILKDKIIDEQRLELKNLNQIRRKIFSVLAHDLRSPAGNILNLVSIYEELKQNGDTVKAEDVIQMIRLSTELIRDLIDKLLLWGKTEAGLSMLGPMRLNLKSAVDKVIKELYYTLNEKKIELDIKVADYFVIYIDSEMFHTILRNLVSNAVKYSYDFGKIIISAAKKDHGMSVEITDFGIGISSQRQAELFNPDIITSTKGTKGETGMGLGLMLTHVFVKLNNGTIDVESLENSGTNVRLWFPAAEKVEKNEEQ
jgi:PAS domain S-box-containing protein